ncbi:hypothetical protein FQN49_001699 [Arthroderma sp. PD_2]|nr:hypothetical protein FQN49_001699 [Arthroderma sp. PD_2]
MSLSPSDPDKVMVIRKVCDDVITCSLPFARFGVLKFGGRATLVRLQTGSIAVFSPVALTPSVREAVNSLNGTVKYLIAPDMEHHLFLNDWIKAYPDADIIAPEGLWEKRQGNPDTTGPRFKYIFTAENKHTLHISDEFAADLDVEYVHAHANRDIVILHKPSSTLIQADMFFNPPANEQYQKSEEGPRDGLANKAYISCMSTEGSAIGQQRFIWYVLSKPDREAFKESVQRIDGWEFDRAIPCHGDTVDQGAKRMFRTLFQWFLPTQGSR